jgi:hypothetical protein
MPTSWLAFGTELPRAAWPAPADATNDAAPAAHSKATILTLRVAVPTSALKVLVMGASTRAAAAAYSAYSEKARGLPYRPSSTERWRKRCNATRMFKDALSGVNSLSANDGGTNSVDGCLEERR